MTCNTTSPPGLAVSEEGKNFAKSLGDRVTGDTKSNVDGSIIDKNDVEKNESSSDSLKEVNNHDNDGEHPDVESRKESPTDHSPSENNLTPNKKMPDQDEPSRESESLLSDECRIRPPVEDTENVKPSHDQKEDHTKTDKKVKQESDPVAHATNDEIMSSIDPLTLPTIGTDVENSDHDDSTTSCPHSSSDQPVSRQSVSEEDKDTVGEKKDAEGCTKQDPEEGPPPLYEMQVRRQPGEPKCLMCTNLDKTPLYLSHCGRGHYFCSSCMEHFLEKTKICPECQKKGFAQGNQPIGQMNWKTMTNCSPPGNRDCGTIIAYFKFDKGIQGPEHPNPGRPYSGLFTTAFLPCNTDGQEICNLLRKAFDARLLFTIGTSPATREENEIVWNGIELKTCQSGGPANYGYPDPSYLDRVKMQLAEKGISCTDD